ncbi:MAG: CPBP family intramembrane glutamic endopeptidase [Acidobacteriota bacterium]
MGPARTYIPFVSISRPLAWILILLALAGSSLIRQLHEFIPEWAPLPWPVRSPLYAFLILLFLLLLAAPERRSSSLRVWRHDGRIYLGVLTPFLVALVYEKVLSITLYEALLDHALRISLIRDHLDSWIHLIIGAGMITAVLLLVPIMRGVRYADFLNSARIRSGLYLQFFALLGAYALIAGLFTLLAGASDEPTLHFPMGTAALLLVVGQGTRAMAEEFYYRGLLQRELTVLMAGLGITRVRDRHALAVAMISLGFGIEHFRFGAPLAESYRGFAYAAAAGLLFGYLLVLTGNVFFCGLVHATNNLVTARVMPWLGTADGSLHIPPESVLFIYLIGVFLLVFVVASFTRGNLRRVLLPDFEVPVAA